MGDMNVRCLLDGKRPEERAPVVQTSPVLEPAG
jgi:hypothetical protein